MEHNIERRDVESFGYEWTKFDQTEVPMDELRWRFNEYFSLFPWSELPANAVGFDLGCGSGRWAKFVAPRVHHLHCIDASGDALSSAKKSLASLPNCEFHHASVDAIPLADASMDFGYSLGVLHHVPDSLAGLVSCVRKLKLGAPFLVYVYYALEDRSAAYRALWHASTLVRKAVVRLPTRGRVVVSEIIAKTVYWPLARASRFAEANGFDVSGLPLSIYRNMSFQTMRTDAYDRFATSLEKRFTRGEVAQWMSNAGLSRISFREGTPYWCAIGYREN